MTAVLILVFVKFGYQILTDARVNLSGSLIRELINSSS